MLRRLVAQLTSVTLAAGVLTAVLSGAAPPASAATTVIPVPTSNAGLGRIVTAPDGTMWFTEEDANKVGKVTPGGQVTEFAFPAEFPGTTTLKDLDVAPDGTIWVVYESGERVRHMSPDGTIIADGQLATSGYPYGEQVRVGPDGTAWITMSYDEDYIVRVVGTTIYSDPNSPGCEDSLGEAADGSMWCRQGDGLIHVNDTASGGVRYPAGRSAAYPYAIAAGPVGSIWFGRYFSGTMFTSPDDGEVGYLDAATSKVTAYDTGSRTAPADLVQGPDGNMWFTSIGAAAGIGHISAGGRGALTAIGGYEPESLTFAKDGAIFATDPTNNVIIRVTTDQLQRTNVDPGDGSVFTQQAAARPVVGTVVVPRKPVAVRKGRVPVTIACPKAAAVCRGKVTLRTTTKAHRPVVRAASYQLKPGKKKTVRLALTKAGTKAVRPGKVTKLRAELTQKGAKTVRKVIKVRR
jgi:virginiamycin B lyase